MKPYYADDQATLYLGDALEVLRALPDGSINCCVTSPPYFGLRDYGVAGQIGAEASPAEFVAALVAVFAEVWRVLADDGTLWLSLGDSYSTGRVTGPGAPSCGTTDTGRSGCPGGGYPSCGPCGGRPASGRDACRTSHNGSQPVPGSDPCAACPNQAHMGSRDPSLGSSDSAHPSATGQSCPAMRDPQPAPTPADGLPPASLGSTTDGSAQPPPGGCWRSVCCGCAQRASGSSARGARPSEHMTGCTCGTGWTSDPSGSRMSDMVSSDSAWGHSTIPFPPEKNLLGIPWRTAFALQDDGWILRNDIIWAKPNGMPESVTDRLSTKHEHLFLFTKSRRYWFNLDPIREPHVSEPGREGENCLRGQKSLRPVGPNSGAYSEGGRNPGDVWTIATQPFSEAHFAVFPIEIPRRAIAAGCKPGGVVLDPFSGSGTTGLAAAQLGRRYVGIDLNREYLDLSLRTRLAQPSLTAEAGGAAQVSRM